MAGLVKPEKCTTCGSGVLHREWYPERWVCENKHVVISRKQLAKTGICRVCSKSRDDVPFDNHGNICKSCKSDYNKDYSIENKEDIKKQHKDSYQVNKKKRKDAVKKAVQRSPEAFIRHLLHHITKNCNYRRVNMHKLNPASLDVDIDFDHLMDLWRKQGGKCVITKLQMNHCWNTMRSISIDRIDSCKGYLKGNVQLVCQVINRAKNNHSNDDIHIFLNQYFEERLVRHVKGLERLSDQSGVWDDDLRKVDKEIVEKLQSAVENCTVFDEQHEHHPVCEG